MKLTTARDFAKRYKIEYHLLLNLIKLNNLKPEFQNKMIRIYKENCLLELKKEILDKSSV